MIKIDSFIKKNGSNSSSSNGGGGFANGATTNTTTVQKELETHKLWGQPFNGTQDVDGDMTVNGNVSISGNVTATNGAISNIESENITNLGALTTDTVDATTINVVNADISNQLNVNDILSIGITTDYLTVTKSAHFWELVVDKISSTKGAIIVSPANCIVEDLDNNNGTYTLYWRAEDKETGKAITNDFKVNDQIICQSFNAADGDTYNVNNKYYWRLVTSVGREYRTDGLRGNKCYWNYIQLSATDGDGSSMPEIGDNIAVLGNRTNEDRQNAIIISSTNSDYLDADIQAPSIVQYKGIKSYNLQSYRYNVIAANGNTFIGNFKVVASDGSLGDIESGKDGKGIKSIVTHYLASNLSSGMGKTTVWDSGSVIPPTLTVTKPYMWQQAKTTYTDNTYILSLPVMIGALGKTGANGKDGKIYILESTPSTIILNSDGSFNRDNQYSDDQYMMVKGYEIVNGKRNNLFTVNGNPITVRLSFNNDSMYTEYTTDDYVQCDFDPRWTDSYYSILAEIKQNGLNNARAIMYEGVEYSKDKILSTLDIPIIKLPFNGIMDKLSMTDARATVNINDDLYVFNEGYVNHIDGDRITRVTDLSKYYIKITDSNGRTAKITPSTNADTFEYNVLWRSKYSEQENRITHFRVQLYDTSDNILDEITYNVTFDAGAVLTVGQNAITSSVQQSKTYTNGQISTVKQTAEGIASRVTAIEGNYVTESEMNQTANNISLNVYDNLKNKTGIDVTTGKITLNADNVQVKGNFNLTDTKNGLTVYDAANTPLINLQPKPISKIGTFKNDRLMTTNLTMTSVKGGSSIIVQTNKSSAISMKKSDVIRLSSIQYTLYATSNGTTIYPNNLFLTGGVRIYNSKGETVLNSSAQFSRNNIHGKYELNTSVSYRTTAEDNYTVNLFITTPSTWSTSYTVSGYGNARIETGNNVQSYIGSDGAFFHNAPNKLIYSAEDELRLQYGFNGIRWSDDTDYNNKAMEVLCSVKSNTDGTYSPLYLPFYNFTPVTQSFTFAYQRVANIASNKYTHNIMPLTDKGILLLDTPATDSNGNYQETWFVLPSESFGSRDGKILFSLPIGYTVKIINNTGDKANVFVTPSASNKNEGVIYTSENTKVNYLKLTGDNSMKTFMYIGGYGTESGTTWRVID